MSLTTTKQKVLILSLYDRGYCLANDLSEQGWNVTLLNLGSNSQVGSIENWSNPFGHFHDSSLTTNQKIFLENLDSSQKKQNGLSVWLPDGPIDFKSPFAKEVLQQRNVPQSLWGEEVPDAPKNRQAPHWFSQLSRSLFAVAQDFSILANSKTDDLKLFSTYSMKQSSRHSIKRNKEISRRKGIEVIDGQLFDWQEHSDKTFHAKIEGVDDDLSFHQCICLLSGFEASSLQSEVSRLFFRDQAVTPDWAWQSFYYSYGPNLYLESAPEHFLLIEDVRDQWAYKNFLIVHHMPEMGELKVSFCWPYSERKNFSYLEKEKEDIKEILLRKMRHLELKSMNRQSNHHCPAFYVYDVKLLEQFKKKFKAPNGVLMNGPEYWGQWDWVSILKSQESILNQMTKQKVSA